MTLLDFPCSDCEQTFNMRIKLKRHRKVHIKKEDIGRDFLIAGGTWTDEEKVNFTFTLSLLIFISGILVPYPIRRSIHPIRKL